MFRGLLISVVSAVSKTSKRRVGAVQVLAYPLPFRKSCGNQLNDALERTHPLCTVVNALLKQRPGGSLRI